MITLNTKAFGKLNEDEFYHFCQDNELLRIEKDKHQNIIIMAPTGSKMGYINLEIAFRVKQWVDKKGVGLVFDSSTGFTLPDGSVRSPDVSVVSNKLWNSISAEQKDRFAPVCPEFVIELRSRNDELKTLLQKMKEYLGNGGESGWLIDPQEQAVYVFDRNNKDFTKQPFHEALIGKYLMEGFSLNLTGIF